MITIKLNGKQIQMSPGLSLLELVHKHVDASQCYSIALNRCFVPRTQYQTVILDEHDEVDVIQPMQGG